MFPNSNGGIGLKGTTWGTHLNRSNEDDSNNRKKGKIKIQERKPLFKPLSPSNSSTPKQFSFANKLPSRESYLAKQETVSNNYTLKQGPRSSLKKRKSSLTLSRTKSSDFFNTLSFGDDSMSQDALPQKINLSNNGDNQNLSDHYNEPVKNSKADPLARFEAEISMDGESFSENLSLTNLDTKSKPGQCPNLNTSAHVARPLSFLGAIGTSVGDSRKAGSLGLSFRDSDSNVGSSYDTKPEITKIVLEGAYMDKSGIDEEEYKTVEGKRKRAESESNDLDISMNHTSKFEPKPKRVCGSEDPIASGSELRFVHKSISFNANREDKYSMTERGDGEYKDKDVIEKENWNQIEQRLITTTTEGIENKYRNNVYSLGFEEEEDVNSAKVAACAGRTALLPLHDASNIGKSLVQNLQKERLLEKVQSGKANENYQKINLKKKVFVRGRAGRMTGAKFRRQEWKKKMNDKEKSETRSKSEKKSSSNTESKNELQESNNIIQSNSHNKSDLKNHEFVNGDTKETNYKGGDEYVAKRKVTSHARKLKAKCKQLVKKSTSKRSKSNMVGSKTCEIDSDANTEKDLWGQDVDEADLLSCFDENGDVKSVSEESVSHNSTIVKGIGNKVDPYYSSDSTYNKQEVLDVLKNKFGHKHFRTGQEEAIRRILCGDSTLVQLATGSGKSLVYQLPAYLYAEREYCITLVVSPLVSLMEDQISGLPPFLRAACFHSSQTLRQREKVVEQIKTAALNQNSQRIHFLLVSPETLAGGGSLFASVLRHLPPIAFVCIDEAHCVSAWSHNFRPTYLRLSRVIKERLGVETLLGLTASAPESTIKDVAQRLNVCLKEGIIRGKLLPTNLTLSVSRGESRGKGKEGDLIALLSSEPFINFSSIIIYCTRRDTCEKLATLVRTQFQDRDVRLNKSNKISQKSRAISLVAEPYHAGLSSYKRKTVQSQFMSGKLRIVVATVAFGMGIDKSDIRAVIHYNMPSSYESYVQEIGRAGRDGLHARCHLFLDSEGKDLSELKRHVYSNSIDRHIIRKLVTEIMQGSSQMQIENGNQMNEVLKKSDAEETLNANLESEKISRRIEMAIPIQRLVEKFDMPEENISTFMCYLEEHEKEWVKLLNPTYSTCKIHCYGGYAQLEKLCRSNPIVAAAYKIAKQNKELKNKSGTIEFPVVQVAANSGWESGVVKRELKNLQWTSYDGSDGKMKQSGILVEFSELALHFEMNRDPSEADLEDIQNYLYKRSVAREMAELENLKGLSNAFRKVSFLAGNMPSEKEETNNIEKHQDDKSDLQINELTLKSDKLKQFLKEYFDNAISSVESALSNLSNKDDNTLSIEVPLKIDENCESQLRAEVRQFVVTHSDHTWTGRAVARIFHGIQSPNFPAKQWGRVRRYWRAHLDIEFPIICKIATQEVLRLRCGKK